jgi:drug/metabolite transporter (DMT)-like permease
MLTTKNIYPPYFRWRSKRFNALFALSLVCFFWGTTWIASKAGVTHMPALQLVSIRQFLAGSIYITFFLIKKQAWPKGKEWYPILILSFLNFMLSNSLSTWGVKYISAGLGAIIGAIFPLWLVIIGLFKRGANFPSKAIAGLVLGFLGICVIFSEHLSDFLDPDFQLGIFLSILATWSWAFGTLFTKEQASQFNPYFSIGLQMMISSLVLYITAKTTGRTIPITEIPWQSWTAIAYMVIFGSVISFIAYLYALQHLPMGMVSVYAYFNPIVAVLLGALLFNESLSFFIAAGGGITLFGVYLVNESFRAKKVDGGRLTVDS